jgi:hypothetical protein
LRSGATLCATGEASLREGPEPPPLLDGFRAATPPAPELRPPADEVSLASGTWLGIRPLEVTPELAASYLADIRETAPLYETERLVHPGLVGRLANAALTQNVRLGPWIHVGSRVAYLAAARIGETLSLRGQVTGNYERKGHRFVELDALILAGARKLARLHHVAIYRPRQVAESG